MCGSCSEAPGHLFDTGGSAGTAGASGGASKGGTANGGSSTSSGGAGASSGGTLATTGGAAQGGTVAATGGAGGRGSGGTAGTSAGAATGGKLGAGGGAGSGGNNLPSEIVQQITKTADDCTWILNNGQYEERLRYSDMEPWLEVGNDGEMGRMGLRFVLPIPPKATIVSASLQLQRVAGTASSTDSMTIQVYDSGNVPAFDGSHHHAPGLHVTAGLFATSVRGTLMGENNKPVTSADVKLLVQRVVDRADFGANATMGSIGFVISPDITTSWAAYGDSSNGTGATLRVTYRPLPG